MLTVTSSANENVDPCDDGCWNSGAAGSGRRGLPPYVDAGVPGRGLPLRSAGSYLATGGGRLKSGDMREGLQDLVGGELSTPELYDAYDGAAGGGIDGGSRIED